MTKMTYVQALDYVLGMVDNDEVAEKLEALKVQLGKRAIRKPTATQRANENVKNAILDILTDTPQTAGNIAEKVDITVQKASALCRQIVANGDAQVTEVKVPKKGKQKGYYLG
jgi:hypothetical protein